MLGQFGSPVVINNVGGNAVVNFEGSINISPKYISKTFSGSGAGHNGVLNLTIAAPSSTNTSIVDFVNQPIAFDN